ncbi:hypothetical protein [Moorena producens]|nr:hypothetical protein [Moorena producens]
MGRWGDGEMGRWGDGGDAHRGLMRCIAFSFFVTPSGIIEEG